MSATDFAATNTSGWSDEQIIEWLKSCPREVPPDIDLWKDIDLAPVTIPLYPDHQVGMEGASQQIPMLPVTEKLYRSGDITKGAGRERAINRAFEKAITPKQFYSVVKKMVDVAQDVNHPQCVAAQKEIMNRMMGKVPLKVTNNTTVTTTVEERKTFFLKMLGVSDNLNLIDGEVVESSEVRDPDGHQQDAQVDPPALPAEVSAGPEPVHPVGEVPPDRSDVGERAEVSPETDQPDGAD